MIAQIAAVTGMNIKNIPNRLGTSLVIVIGIAGVVGVLVALLSMAKGFEATLGSTGAPDRAIVLRSGSNDELSSIILREQANLVMGAAGVAKDEKGQPIAVGEFYLLTDVPKPGSPGPNNVVVRGTSADVLKLRTEGKIVEGRMFTPGLREVVVGQTLTAQFPSLKVGGKVEVRDGAWDIVGIFTTEGDVHESEMWIDADTIQSITKRNAYSTVTVRLTSEAAFEDYKTALAADPQLRVTPQREPDYYASRSKALSNLINVLGYSVSIIMGIGALFGALNTMYAAVSTRTVEIATLRAIGFGGTPVVISVLIEALLLSIAGGIVGGLIAYVVFNGYTVNTLNFQTFSQVAFDFKVTPDLLKIGVIWACLIGLVGGLFPAIRAARLPVVDALRAS